MRPATAGRPRPAAGRGHRGGSGSWKRQAPVGGDVRCAKAVEREAGEMVRGDTGSVRRAFFRGFLRGLRVLWPVLSGLFVVIAVLGAVVGAAEGWGIAQGVYFSFITGL